MKIYIKHFKLLILLFAINSCSIKKISLKWESAPVFDKPECVLYYQDSILFVSNIGGSPSKKDSNGFISTIDTNGKIIDIQWLKGLDAPKGMDIKNDKLYITDINKILIIEIGTKNIIDEIFIENSKFLNDIVVDKDSNIYISDTKNNCVYLLNDIGQNQINGIYKGANGLSIKNGNLYIGTKDCIYKYNIETNKYQKLLDNTGNVDGIFVFNDDKILISNYFNKLTLIEEDEIKILLKGIIFKDCITDFQYLENGILIVPTFDKTVKAYELN
ncbi:MAG: hypothetical protein ABF289_05525 [Clostridiales bacterium]